jgi:serine/threonine protein phosphatase PrpC
VKAEQIAHVRDLERVFVAAGAAPPRRLALFSVVDGHAGFKAAEFVVGNVAETFWNAVFALQEEQTLDQADLNLHEKNDGGSGGGNGGKGANTSEKSCAAFSEGEHGPVQEEQGGGVRGGSDVDDERVGRFIRDALKRTMTGLDRAWLNRVHGARPKINDGACVLLCLMVDSKMHLAHVGDCRAVLYSASGKFRALTRDHKPGISKSEDRRVQKAGGEIQRGQGGAESRVCAAGTRISVTRAIGDANLKRGAVPILSPEPDTCTVDLAGKNRWTLVMASDGVWFRMGNATVSSFLRKVRGGANTGPRAGTSHVPGNDVSPSVAELLVRDSYRRGSFDNISAIIVTETEREM